MSEPRTEAGKRLLSDFEQSEAGYLQMTSHRFSSSWFTEKVRQSLPAIEAEAIADDRADLVAKWEEAKRTKRSSMTDVGEVIDVVDALLEPASAEEGK